MHQDYAISYHVTLLGTELWYLPLAMLAFARDTAQCTSGAYKIVDRSILANEVLRRRTFYWVRCVSDRPDISAPASRIKGQSSYAISMKKIRIFLLIAGTTQGTLHFGSCLSYDLQRNVAAVPVPNSEHAWIRWRLWEQLNPWAVAVTLSTRLK